MDPTSGTAALLEITRVLGEMYRNGILSINICLSFVKYDSYRFSTSS